MSDHVRILAWLNIVLGGLGLLAAVVIISIVGGVAGIVGIAALNDPDTIRVAVPILGMVGTALFIVLTLLSLPGIILGAGLLSFRPWARTLGIIVSALNLLNIPIGTAIGVYGLWILLNQETERLFAARSSAHNCNQ